MHVFISGCVIRFWNNLREPKIQQHAAAHAAQADLRLMLSGHARCWSYKVCLFLAQLSNYTGRDFFPASYRTPILTGQPRLLPSDAYESLWALSFNACEVQSTLRSFWHDRLVNLCTGSPRTCPALPVYHVYVQWMGVRGSDQKWMSYSHLVLPREHAVALMRFRLGAWAFLAVNKGRLVSRGANRVARNQRACPICSSGVEDEWHVVFKCHHYDHIRAQFPDLFPTSPPPDGDSAAMLCIVNTPNQARLAHMLCMMSAARLSH